MRYLTPEACAAVLRLSRHCRRRISSTATALVRNTPYPHRRRPVKPRYRISERYKPSSVHRHLYRHPEPPAHAMRPLRRQFCIALCSVLLHQPRSPCIAPHCAAADVITTATPGAHATRLRTVGRGISQMRASGSMLTTQNNQRHKRCLPRMARMAHVCLRAPAGRLPQPGVTLLHTSTRDCIRGT